MFFVGTRAVVHHPTMSSSPTKIEASTAAATAAEVVGGTSLLACAELPAEAAAEIAALKKQVRSLHAPQALEAAALR